MKSALFAALALFLNWVEGAPIQRVPPGWQMGTGGADVKIRVFLDLLCPYSRDAYGVFKELLPKDSPVKGKTYADLIDLKVNVFVLPYHIHSYQLAQIVPYIEDQCAANS